MRAIAGFVGGLGLLVAVAACLPGDDGISSEEAHDTEAPLSEGSLEARALLAMLGDAAITDATLRSAGATKPVAAAILAHRAGADGAFGTADDDRFGTVAEVDAIKGVGPVTLGKLAAHAIALGYPSERGLYHGVYFTEKQAARTLALVNEAALAELDVDAYLDKRAAENILAARPIVSMDQLASISRVKATAVRLLRDHADRTRSAPICDAGVPCPTGLWCTGGSTTLGRCVDTGVEGSGDPCSAAGACGAELVCGGRNDTFAGLCVPEWMRDEFVDESTGSIPDGLEGGTGHGVWVFGLATVPMDAVVRTRIDHPRPADLELTLTNPSGTTVMVWPRGAGAVPESIPVGVPGDESANGEWILTVRDVVAGSTGTTRLFTLELTTRFD